MLADTLIDGLTPIIGAQGNSFFIIFISVLIFKIIKDFRLKLLPLGLILVTVTLLLSAFATKTISWTDPIDKIKVSLHQPNFCLLYTSDAADE